MPNPHAKEVQYICDHLRTTDLRLGIVHGLAATFLKKRMDSEMCELWYSALNCYPDLVHDVIHEVGLRLEDRKAIS